MRSVPFAAPAAVLCGLLVAQPAHASVVLSATRVVFPGDARDVTVRLTNRREQPALVQAWIEPTGATPSPFAIDPPLVRIEPGRGQALRIHKLPGALPKDRESLFWLNVLDVPSKQDPVAAHARVNVVLRSRVKVFFRPAGLPGSAAKAPAQLRWHLREGHALEIANPTPYHVTVQRVMLGDTQVVRGDTVAPFGRLSLPIGAPMPLVRDRVVFDVINDIGGSERHMAPWSRGDIPRGR